MDSDVLHYGLGTYIGEVVSCGGVFVGSLCIVYQENRVSSKDDVKLLGIIASAIVGEEKHRKAITALKESERRYERLVESLTDNLYGVRFENSPMACPSGPGVLP